MLNFFYNLGKVALYAVLAAGVLLSLALIVGALLFNIDGEVVITWFSLVFIGVFAIFLITALGAFLIWFLFTNNKLLPLFVLLFGAFALISIILVILGGVIDLPVFDFIAFLEKLLTKQPAQPV